MGKNTATPESNRPKRQNAGRKIKQLIVNEKNKEEQADDDFYENLYGGFKEENNDNNYFKSESESESEDSDIDDSEESEEVEVKKEEGQAVQADQKDVAAKVSRKRPISYRKYELKEGALEKSLASLDEMTNKLRQEISTKSNNAQLKLSLDEKERLRHKKYQEKMLKEAALTEAINIQSLDQYAGSLKKETLMAAVNKRRRKSWYETFNHVLMKKPFVRQTRRKDEPTSITFYASNKNELEEMVRPFKKRDELGE